MVLWAIREGGDGVKNTAVLIVGTSRLLLACVVEFIKQPPQLLPPNSLWAGSILTNWGRLFCCCCLA